MVEGPHLAYLYLVALRSVDFHHFVVLPKQIKLKTM